MLGLPRTGCSQVDFRPGGFGSRRLVQGVDGVTGRPETGDRFGAAVAAGDGYLVVGVPGEDLPDHLGRPRRGAGRVQPFRLAASGPLPINVAPLTGAVTLPFSIR